MRKLWTEEENNLIKLLRSQKLTYKEMVPYFPDRNLRTISVQANKLLEPSKTAVSWTKADESKLVELREAGVSYKEVAEILGRTYNAVKTKGCTLMKSSYTRSGPKESYEDKKERALSDLTSIEREFIDTGQDFFRF